MKPSTLDQDGDTGRELRPLVVFSLGSQRFGLALERVQRVLGIMSITPLPGSPPIVVGVVNLAGQVLPVVDVRRRFSVPGRELRLSDQLIIAQTAARTVALWVDETLGVVEISRQHITPASEILPGLELVDGVLRLEDGLILIHDLDRLLSLEEQRTVDSALSANGLLPPASNNKTASGGVA